MRVFPFTSDHAAAVRLRDLIEGPLHVEDVHRGFDQDRFVYECWNEADLVARGEGATAELAICDGFMDCGRRVNAESLRRNSALTPLGL